jgi:glycosyltransferase involved in cell wall biosynthesis
VASDLPSVREIVRDGIDGRLVRPDRPAELARAIRIMLEYPGALAEMKQNARLRIQDSFTWQKSLSQLAGLYRSLGPAAEVIA